MTPCLAYINTFKLVYGWSKSKLTSLKNLPVLDLELEGVIKFQQQILAHFKWGPHSHVCNASISAHGGTNQPSPPKKNEK